MFRMKNKNKSKMEIYYVDKNKKRITNKSQLERIKKLRIPPAWNQVIVSTQLNAKVQAIGIDEKGRSQFIYSTKHKEKSKSEKYKRVAALGIKLHDFIKKLKKEIRKNGYYKEHHPDITLSQTPENLTVSISPYFKFGCGWFTLYSKKVLDLIIHTT